MNSVKAKEHAVFRELARVRQYFDKVKAAESAASKPTQQVDKAAAGRFIKHALVGTICAVSPHTEICFMQPLKNQVWSK